MSLRTSLFGTFVLAALLTPSTPSTVAGQRLRTASTRQTVEIHFADDVVVRWQHAPMQFDEKGKPVKPTAEQLKALKGDSNQPGYAAEVSDLKAGQIVKVHLSRRKLPKSDTSGEAGAEKKPHWTSVGDLTGRVVRVPGAAAKGNGKQGSDTEAPLAIAVQEVFLTRFKVPSNQGKATLGPDVFARKVMIVKDAPDEKGATKK
jgi:hypothetical protein